jgi:hypothetical protein
MAMKIITRLGILTMPLLLSACLGDSVGDFPKQETLCNFDEAREQLRAASAENFPAPDVTEVLVNGVSLWSSAHPSQSLSLRPRDLITLRGSGFGGGPDIDFSKIMIGNTRVLETDLRMFEQRLDIGKQVNFEIPRTHSSWDKDIVSWQDNEVVFYVPRHASSGPLQLQVQKRSGWLESLIRPGQPHNVIDAQTARITDPEFVHECDVVSLLSEETKGITPIAVTVDNPDFDQLVRYGREIFWSYDFNVGLAHSVRNLDWSKIFSYRTRDPITRDMADPLKLFGAYPMKRDQVPDEAWRDIYFNPYPQPNPIPGLLTVEPQLTRGNTRDSGWVGYRYAESSHPYVGRGERIGFNCASCHGYQITYQPAPNETITRVFPGLPNPQWSMKWTVLGDKLGTTTATFDGINGKEPGPSWAPGDANIDKTMLLYHMPAGTGEHNIVRMANEGSKTDNDYQFSPIVIPNVTNYMAIRRSLSHTESYVGFEGSYIHSQEPDGATGSMGKPGLQALTAYMTTLDQHDNDLINAGLYRWLKHTGRLGAQTGDATLAEGEFVARGWQDFPGVQAAVDAGQVAYDRDCGSCHNDALGANTNERMFRLDEVGRFFAPTIYQKDQQSIRASFLRNIYWVQSRGLLSDGHVRNVEDLVHPQRCQEGSPLYNQYYTLHPPVRPALGSADQPANWPDLNRKGDVFRVPRSDEKWFDPVPAQRNRFIERHKYFTLVSWDSKHYYWDYQKMRAEYGPAEMGTPTPIGLPATPHPWCAASPADVMSLVQYVLTL